MRVSILLVCFIASASIYIGCNKYTIQKPFTHPNKIVSGWTDSTNPELRTQFSFNEANNVIKEESGTEISSYEFAKDSIIIKEFNKEENRFVYEFKGRLDTKKRLVSGIANSSYITSAPDTVQHYFIYDKAGFLIMETRISSTSDSFVIKYGYEDNLLKKTFTYSNNELYNTKEFEYYKNDLTPGLPEESKFRKNINNLVGRSGSNLVKKIISTGQNGKKKYILNYEYKKDANGYAYKMISRKGKKIYNSISYFYISSPNTPNRLLAGVN